MPRGAPLIRAYQPHDKAAVLRLFTNGMCVGAAVPCCLCPPRTPQPPHHAPAPGRWDNLPQMVIQCLKKQALLRHATLLLAMAAAWAVGWGVVPWAWAIPACVGAALVVPAAVTCAIAWPLWRYIRHSRWATCARG